MLGRRPIADVFAQATAVVAALAGVLDPVQRSALDQRPADGGLDAAGDPRPGAERGDPPADASADHAAIGSSAGPGTTVDRRLIVDLGSGGGTPGLVVAWYRPDDEVVLIERRATRADHLTRLVRRLGLCNAAVLARDAAGVSAELGRPAAAVTARGFGPPRHLLRLATPLLDQDAVLIVTEPPQPSATATTERGGWRDLTAAELAGAGFRRRETRDRRVAVLQRQH